jgi:hypothetical protein
MSTNRTIPTTTSGIQTVKGPPFDGRTHPNLQAAEAPKGGRLGLIRQKVDAACVDTPSLYRKNDEKPVLNKAQNLRRERFADQRQASAIWRHYNKDYAASTAAGRGVTACAWSVIAGRTADLYRVEKPKEGGAVRAHWEGLKMCGLRWVCPCCTKRKSEECRKQVNAGLSVARSRGLRPVFLTLTARHTKKMPLAVYWSKLGAADKELKRSGPWKRLNKVMGGGFAKATECTYGKNGWHPHPHYILLLSLKTEEEAIEAVEELRDEWLKQLEAQGLDGTSPAAIKRSFDVRGAAAAGEYLTKWGAAEELTLGAEKVGQAKGRTPWQLLRDSRTADTDKEQKHAAARWYEFIQAFEGVHQLRQSPKFRELVKAYEPPEEEKPLEKNLILSLGQNSFSHAVYRKTNMCEAVEQTTLEDSRAAAKNAMFGETDKQAFEQEEEWSPLDATDFKI